VDFRLIDIVAVREDFDIWELISLIVENFMLIFIMLALATSIQIANRRQRHKIVKKFIWWNHRPVGGPLMFPFRIPLAAASAGWLLITWNCLRIFELPVLGLISGLMLLVSVLALSRQTSIRQTYDDPFEVLKGIGIEHEVPKWWKL